MLTTARTAEVIQANELEFDLTNRVWTIRAVRMKTNEEHIVYLSNTALAFAKQQIDDASNLTSWLFPSPTASGDGLSNMALLQLVKRMEANKLTTVRGLRSTFSTWTNETNQARKDVVEACLAHTEQDKIRAA